MSFKVWEPSGDRVSDTPEFEVGHIGAGKVFYSTLECGDKNIVHQGGESSGKTVNILIALAYRAATQKRHDGMPLRITVTSQSYAHLKAGAMQDFATYVEPHFATVISRFHITESCYYFKNGNTIRFATFDKELKARGPRREYLYINEANSFPYETYRQLDSRTKYQTIIDYNPSSKFWAHEKLIGQDNVTRFISDHRQNKFLSDFDHNRIESYIDEDLFRVYGRGLTGNVKGIIYPNWVMITPEEFDAKLEETGKPFTGGLDFGHTNNNTAGIKMFETDDAVYFKKIMYKKGVGDGHMFGVKDAEAQEINEAFEAEGFTNKNIVVCDNAGAGAIIACNKLKRVRYIGAIKGAGSVLEGINMLKKRRVFFAGIEIKKETEKYLWLTDKQGNLTNDPAPSTCDALDACRYPYYFRYFRK